MAEPSSSAAGGDGDAAAAGARAAAEALRRRKEAFVTGHGGTSKWEIFCIIGVLPMCMLFGAPGGSARGAGGAAQRFSGEHARSEAA